MEVLHPRCAGIDIGKRSVVACRVVPGDGGRAHKVVRSFGTMTRDLLALADWLGEGGVTHVAMESTGSYWKPVWNLFEERFELLLANAAHLKAVPGRKTDVRDAEWIADLLRHGLLRPSRVPSRDERELRELTRYRTSLVQERAAELNRIEKVLEGANIKLAAVASTLGGVSAQAMLGALVEGGADPVALAEMARGRLRGKRDALTVSLEGSVGAHQRFVLGAQLRHLAEIDRLIAELGAEIDARLRPQEQAIRDLVTVPGIGRLTAEVILAEVGPDMADYGSAARLASWAGMCPGNHESAGRSQSGRTRKGSPWLRGSLIQAAKAAGRTQTYLGAQYRRIATRRGSRRAAVAVAHSLLRIAYAILLHGGPFRDLGPNHFDERDADHVRRRLTKRLEALGFQVTLEPRTA